MAKVIVSRLVENKLLYLTEVLYDEEYFEFKEDAQLYVIKFQTLFSLFLLSDTNLPNTTIMALTTVNMSQTETQHGLYLLM